MRGYGASENELPQLNPNECVAIRDTLSEYLGREEYVSSSKLRSAYSSFKRRNKEISRSSILGAIFHRLVLEEPDDFNLDMTEITNGWTDHRLSQFDLQNIKGARNQLNQWSNKLFCDWVSLGDVETSIYWKDESGSSWRARPDIITEDFVIDLKTFSGKNQKRFLKNRDRNGFLIQAGHYLDGLKYLHHRSFNFGFLCIDLTKPFRIQLDILEEPQLVRAEELLSEAKEAYIKGFRGVPRQHP
ncbi:MAG: PD-(D/E)XK nuclease-like domain-containing protein [Burkholderiales bacterium]|nr:PD-(D/E)XK nuclease-like domain-containing protein [Burkholderiales bacterium]OUT78783.1 MAG: hypothetical protein CBB82_02835 [Betaproteobacteria bacterium TMED22]|tara:strand:- start:47866 stop:48597 length:732 start_codon:yes stop_codon:yes gene_type:complete